MGDQQLRFRVVYASSEDPDYPASELNAHTSHTRGWQSARCVPATGQRANTGETARRLGHGAVRTATRAHARRAR